MTLEEKLILFKEKGFTGDIETGIVTSHTGKVINNISKDGYIRLCSPKNKKSIHVYAHQFIWYLATGEISDIIDHINRNKSDNKISNLRNVNLHKNQFNRNAKGYSYNKLAKKYMARICLNYKHINLGLFNTPEEAQQAYLNAKKIYHII